MLLTCVVEILIILYIIYITADEDDLEKTKAAVIAAKERMPNFKMEPVDFEKV